MCPRFAQKFMQGVSAKYFLRASCESSRQRFRPKFLFVSCESSRDVCQLKCLFALRKQVQSRYSNQKLFFLVPSCAVHQYPTTFISTFEAVVHVNCLLYIIIPCLLILTSLALIFQMGCYCSKILFVHRVIATSALVVEIQGHHCLTLCNSGCV